MPDSTLSAPPRSDAPAAAIANARPEEIPTTKAKTPSRTIYRTLDAWRGLAALAVVLLHSYNCQIERAPDLEQNVFFYPLQYGYLGVELFFVISGYCIAAAALSHMKRQEHVGKFAWARLRRIFPPYWASCLLFLGGALIMLFLIKRGIAHNSQIVGIMDFSQHSPLYFLTNATLTQLPLRQQLMNPVAWTLGYELAFYGIFAIAIAALAKQGADRVLLVLHGVTAGTLLWQIIAPQTCPFPFDMWPQFGLGILLFDYLRRRQSREVGVAVVGVLTLFAAFILLRDVPIGTLSHSSRIAGVVVVAFTVLLAALFPVDERLARNPVMRALGFVGIFSYSLYLVNFLALGMLRQVEKISVFQHYPAIGVLFQAIATVGIGYLFFLLFEKPFLNTRRQPLKAGEAQTASAKTAKA